MKLLKTFFAIIVLKVCFGCSSVKNKETSNTETVVKIDTKENEGYTKGTIVFSDKANDCAYTLKTDGEDNILYDPINLDKKYEKHDEKVWFTFSPLRMMNRCEKANPIYITDIKKQD